MPKIERKKLVQIHCPNCGSKISIDPANDTVEAYPVPPKEEVEKGGNPNGLSDNGAENEEESPRNDDDDDIFFPKDK